MCVCTLSHSVMCLSLASIPDIDESESVSCSVVTDSFDPRDCSPPVSSVHGILQARVLEWLAISFSRGSPRRRDRTRLSHTAGGFFAFWATREALISNLNLHLHLRLHSCLHPHHLFPYPNLNSYPCPPLGSPGRYFGFTSRPWQRREHWNKANHTIFWLSRAYESYVYTKTVVY